MKTPIQTPFLDDEDNRWSQAEDETLLRLVASERPWSEVAEEISRELQDRTPVACKRRFEHIAEMLK